MLGFIFRNILPFILDKQHGLKKHLNLKKKIKKETIFIPKIEFYTLIHRMKMSIDM